MARPSKTGVDYFPLDVVDDDKIELLEAKFGLEGYAILIKIWKKIYKEGYYTDWNDDIEMLFSRRINSSINLVNSVVNECLRRNLFSKIIFDKYKILTSNGIQERYFKICKDAKRKNVKIVREYLITDIVKFGLTLKETKLTPEETIINSSESTQRKEEERKEDKTKEDDDLKSASAEIFKFYNNNYGMITPFEAQQINSFLEDGVESALIIRAMEVGIENKARNWAYVRKILQNKLELNIKTLEQFKAYENERQSKSSNKNKEEVLTGRDALNKLMREEGMII